MNNGGPNHRTEKSNILYDALADVIEKHKKGMTTYQILGTLTSLQLRFWERYAKSKRKQTKEKE